MNQTHEPSILTVREAADLLRVSERSLLPMAASPYGWTSARPNILRRKPTRRPLRLIVGRRPWARQPKPSGLLKLTWVHQTEDDDERQWLVYGMFAKGEMSVLFGEPGHGMRDVKCYLGCDD